MHWYDLFGGRVGIACWSWIFLLGCLMCCAWAVVTTERDYPPVTPKLASLATPVELEQWTPWERLV